MGAGSIPWLRPERLQRSLCFPELMRVRSVSIGVENDPRWRLWNYNSILFQRLFSGLFTSSACKRCRSHIHLFARTSTDFDQRQLLLFFTKTNLRKPRSRVSQSSSSVVMLNGEELWGWEWFLGHYLTARACTFGDTLPGHASDLLVKTLMTSVTV